MIRESLLKLDPPPRLQKLIDAAQDYPCAWCNAQDGTIIAAHCNELAFGRGAYFKTANYLIAYLCVRCHDAVDGRSPGLDKAEKRAMWHRSHTQTVAWWWRDGLVKVA